MRAGVITGVGGALPEQTLTNADLESMMDTSDQWIVERTGIRERRVGGVTSALAVEAGGKALAAAGVDPADIGLLILATTTPDRTVPATSASVSEELGMRCGAFDVNAACAGWVYALVAAQGFVATGVDKVLVIGADTLSRFTDYTDRGTAILFSDGAGASVVEGREGREGSLGLLGWDLGCDGSAESILYCDYGGLIKMEGREVFRRAVRVMVDSSKRSLEMAGVTAHDVDLVIPHQANIRIIESANQRLGIPMEKSSVIIDRIGNSSSATIPLALEAAIAQGRLHDGDVVLFTGFGAGMTWASAVVRWGQT
ncbi:MAG: beta-ketoacyl-ACP synthase III [Acidimicrobiia bacterium]|nr:beta-ketoacyl-ACP synthase III [Acidimicrobiia bacterium]